MRGVDGTYGFAKDGVRAGGVALLAGDVLIVGDVRFDWCGELCFVVGECCYRLRLLSLV